MAQGKQHMAQCHTKRGHGEPYSIQKKYLFHQIPLKHFEKKRERVPFVSIVSYFNFQEHMVFGGKINYEIDSKIPQVQK